MKLDAEITPFELNVRLADSPPPTLVDVRWCVDTQDGTRNAIARAPRARTVA